MTASFLHTLRPQPAIEPSLQAADDVPVISSFDLAVLDKGLMVLPEPIAPSALRLMRSTEVLAVVAEASKDLPVERLRTTARSIVRSDDGL